MYKETSYLFVVSRESLHSYRLPPADEITRLAQAFRAQVGRPPGPRVARVREFQTYTQTARQLCDRLLAPAAEVLTQKRRLVIIPDGGLYYLPFECLVSKEPDRSDRADYRTLSFVLHQWEISYAPSACI